jgi:hypothetical protein
VGPAVRRQRGWPRGSGDSDGILLDEYLPQEQDAALEVIAWLAEQDWRSGAVGMIGVSSYWPWAVETDSEMKSTATEFVVEQRLDAYEGDELVASRTWSLRFPRDGV